MLMKSLEQVRAAAAELERIASIAKWVAQNGGVSASVSLPINGRLVVYPNGQFVRAA
jgi:hypothetical protein